MPESLATALAADLLRTYGKATRTPERRRGGFSLNRLRQALEYVDAHLSDALSLTELATVTGFQCHFASAFKTTMGSSPHCYVIERRIRRAHQLLRDTKLSILAYAVGFSSQSHLNENFRRVVGVTPNKFRWAIDSTIPALS